ncbi:hypothetical protein OROHE_008352 [Orobanche hederae]
MKEKRFNRRLNFDKPAVNDLSSAERGEEEEMSGLQGFYYDAFYGEDSLRLSEQHFDVEKAKSKILSAIEVTKEQALEMFAENKLKVEVINDLPADNTITVYRLHQFTGWEIKTEKVYKGFMEYLFQMKSNSRQLEKYIDDQEEAKKYDYRELGKKQELFFFHPYRYPRKLNLPYHGKQVLNKLLEFTHNQYWNSGREVIMRICQTLLEIVE